MKRNKAHIILFSAFALVAVMSAPRPAPAQDAKQPYPTMAPVEQYLMDRDAEIALARSAAPDAISHDASVITPLGSAVSTLCALRDPNEDIV